MEIALLILVAICVIALIYISKRRKELEKSLSETPDTPVADSDKNDNAPKKEEKTSNPAQHMIYEFTARSEIRCCPFCDGENSIVARVCDICGRDI